MRRVLRGEGPSQFGEFAPNEPGKTEKVTERRENARRRAVREPNREKTVRAKKRETGEEEPGQRVKISDVAAGNRKSGNPI